MTASMIAFAGGFIGGSLVALLYEWRIIKIYQQAAAAMEALMDQHDAVVRGLIEHIKQLEDENSDLQTAIARKP